MTHPVVLIADPLSPAAVDALGEGVEIRHCDGTDRAALLAAVRDADALLVRSGTRADAEVIAAGTRLKVIGRAGVGLDNVDVDAATRAGVLVVNTPTANIVSAAELTCALLLAAARNVPQAGHSLKQGSWERSRFTGTELSGKVLGIVGLGRIGALVAERMTAFGMKIVAYDPYVTPARAAELGIETTGLDDLLTRADFVTVHLPRTPETIGLIGKDELAKAKPTAYFVNVARGGIIDEPALADALRAGRIAGAALDVFETEPPVDSPLLTLDNVVATPHLGASTHEAQEKAGTQVAKSVIQALTGTPVPDAVNTPEPRPFAAVGS